jgi:integrase
MLGALALADLRPTDVEQMTDGIVARGRSGTTARAVRTTLRRALNDAMRDALVMRNVASLSRPPRVERRELHVLTGEATRKLLGLAWGDLVDIEGPTPTLTVHRSLARVADGWGLAQPKTSRSRRTLELGPTTVRALRRQRARQAEARLAAGDLWQNVDNLVFTDELGRPESGSHVSKAFATALARLGLPHVGFHDLRHGVASLMLAQGVPLKLVSEALGHSTITITADVCSHLDREQRRVAANAIELAIGGES